MDLSLMQKRIEETSLLLEIGDRLDREGRALAVIDGDCCAGKTTLARAAIALLYQGDIIPMDDFFLPPSLRSEERLRIPGGNVHFERFQAEALEGLMVSLLTVPSPTRLPAEKGTWRPFTYGQYDCRLDRITPRRVSPRALVIVEGSYSLHPVFSEGYKALHALRIFLSVSPEEQLRRLQKRDPALLERFRQDWIPLEKAYAKAYDVKGSADISLCTDGWADQG